MKYEYKTKLAPSFYSADSYDEIDSYDEKLTSFINEYAGNGWEYFDSILLHKRNNVETYLIFRRTLQN